MSDFSKRIKSLRKDNEMTQDDLAKLEKLKALRRMSLRVL